MATLATVRSWTISQCTGHAPTRDLFAGVRLYGPRSSGKSTFINCVWRVLQDETGPFVVKAHSQDSAAATGTQHPAWLNIPISPGFRLCDTPGLSDPRSNLPPDIARLQAIRTQTRKTVVKEHYFQQSIYVIPQAYTQNCCQQQQPDGRCVCPIAAAFQEQYTAGRTTEFDVHPYILVTKVANFGNMNPQQIQAEKTRIAGFLGVQAHYVFLIDNYTPTSHQRTQAVDTVVIDLLWAVLQSMQIDQFPPPVRWWQIWRWGE